MKKLSSYILAPVVAVALVAGMAPVASAGIFNENIIIDDKRARRVPPPRPVCKPLQACMVVIDSH